MNRTAKLSKPGKYILLLIISAIGALIYQTRTAGIFACEGHKYGPDDFQAYCNSTSYFSYDQGAFLYQLEPLAYSNAKEADVLFIGNSKMQFAMSTEATEDWFAKFPANYFLFGFTHNENTEYFSPVLQAMNPAAKVYVVHLDFLFTGETTPPMLAIKQDPDPVATLRNKRRWQPVHRTICSLFPSFCGGEFGLLRSRRNGQWLLTGGQDNILRTGIGDGPQLDSELWETYAQRADEFLSQLPVERECVVLTIIPSESTRRAEAESIAKSLGMPLIAPEIDDLRTFDRNHLDPDSAERWSHEFLGNAAESMHRCLAQTRGRRN